MIIIYVPIIATTSRQDQDMYWTDERLKHMDEVLLPSRAEQNAFLGFLTYTVLLNSSVFVLEGFLLHRCLV